MTKLSWAERLVLWNQYEIMKALDPKNAKDHVEAQEILESGYEGFYGQLNMSINETPVSAAETREVIDILDMFRAITFSAKRLGYAPKNSAAKFEGFDGNNDHPQFGIARFLRRTQGKWEELADCPDNSHTQTSLPRYRRMLAEWNQRGKKHNLSAEDIEGIAGA